MARKYIILVLVMGFILAGCNLPGAAAPIATLDVNAVITSAAATAFVQLSAIAGLSSATPTPTITPEPPTFTPQATEEVKLEPVDAVCTYPATVRSWPGKGGENLGFVAYNRGVKVLARNNFGAWLYIVWADSPSGRGWVLAQAFNISGEIGRLPIALETENGIVFLPPIIWEITGTPLPLPTVSNDPELRPATVIERLSVRVCPTQACLLIGYLNPGDQVIMTGRYGDNKWAQIDYPSGIQGKAWISRDSIQPGTESFGGLPYFDVLGTPITPEPPTATPDPNISPTPTNTPTVTPAGPLAEITEMTTVFTLMSSLSPEVGTLNPKEKIHITAQSFNKLWFEIQYPVDTNGRAYISTKNVKLLGDFRYVPYTDARGTPFPTP